MDDQQQDHISRQGRIAALLAANYLLLVQVNEEWNGATGFSQSITQEMIDEIPLFAANHITLSDLQAVGYLIGVLTNSVQADIVQIVKLSALVE